MEDRTELTVVRDRRDYRLSYVDLNQRETGIRQGTCMILLMFAALAGFAEFSGLALAILAGVVLYGVHRLIRQLWWLHRLPKWAFAPTVYRVDELGVEIETEVSHRLIKWVGIAKVRKTDSSWFFICPGQSPIALARRTLSEEAEKELTEVVEHYLKLKAEALA